MLRGSRHGDTWRSEAVRTSAAGALSRPAFCPTTRVAAAAAACVALALALASGAVTNSPLAGRAFWTHSRTMGGTYKGQVQVLGVVRGKLLVCYDQNLAGVRVQANGTFLEEDGEKNWFAKEQRYGMRSCKYAEFKLPILPAYIRAWVHQQGTGDVLDLHEKLIMPKEVPDMAQWNDKFMIRGANKKNLDHAARVTGDRFDLPSASEVRSFHVETGPGRIRGGSTAAGQLPPGRSGKLGAGQVAGRGAEFPQQQRMLSRPEGRQATQQATPQRPPPLRMGRGEREQQSVARRERKVVFGSPDMSADWDTP